MGIAVRIDKVEQDKFKKTQFIHLGDRAVFIYNSCKLFIGQIVIFIIGTSIFLVSPAKEAKSSFCNFPFSDKSKRRTK